MDERKRGAGNPSCPWCGAQTTIRNGHVRGRQRFLCKACEAFFGPTTGTPLYGLKTPPQEVARSLQVVMRRGSLTAAEEVTGHTYETIGRWLRLAGEHAEVLTEALVKDLKLSAAEVDAFWSFVKRSTARLAERPPRRAEWVNAGPA